MDALEAFYYSKQQDLNFFFETLKKKKLYDRCSYPQLMALWNNEEIPSLMFIGQEPNGWGGGESIKELMAEYLNFNLGENYSSPFWEWIWWISEKLGFKGKHPFLYTNLQKISGVDGGPALEEITNLENSLFGILHEEIQILNPQVCIFTTGPNYDKYIKSKFKGVHFNKIQGFTERQMVQLESPLLPKLSFRIYHPGYLNRNEELGKKIIAKLCEIYSLSQ